MTRKLFLTILLILGCMPAAADKIHTFLVCDTEAHTIGYSVEQNLKNIRKELILAAKNTGLEMHENVYSGQEANASFLEHLRTLQPGENDVVFFYWSGHGFRTVTNETIWPSFSFANDWSRVNLEDIIEILIAKKPRLLLVFADTCNDSIPERFAPPPVHLSRPKHAQDPLNYAVLFLEAEGAYIASSSSPGEDSWYKFIGGGYFTNALIKSLQEELYKPGTNWEIVLERTCQDSSFQSLPRVQTPQYKFIPFEK